ncbi:MAG: hypothetical protein WDA71_03000 [Actinomycetota bacterium]
MPRHRWNKVAAIALAALLVGVVAAPAAADGGDFSLDSVAAGPGSYNHATGMGGQYGARVINKATGVLESLEGADFSCGDKVVFFTEVTTDSSGAFPGPQTVLVTYSFDMGPLGPNGTGFSIPVTASLNLPDSGNSGLDGNEVVSLAGVPSEVGGKLVSVISVSGLDPGDVVIARQVVTLACSGVAGGNGNLQVQITDAKVVAPDSEKGNISGGRQTIPLKDARDVSPGSITIVKDSVPNDAQDFSYSTTGGLNPTPFSLDDDSDPNLSNTKSFTDLAPGTYTVTEAAASGWNLTAINCTGGTTEVNLTDRTVSITITAGQSASCTFVNNRLSGSITIVKDSVPNDAQDFSYSTTGGLNPTPFSLDDDSDPTLSNTQDFTGVTPGTYTVAEDPVTGWSLTGITCLGGTPDVDLNNRKVTVTLALGESATCTFTNTAQTAHLKLVKVVTNDNGGTAGATDFILTATGPTPISGAGGVDSDVKAGTYTLSETGPDGYTPGTWSCVGGSLSGDKVTLALGESATCTITNDDIRRPSPPPPVVTAVHPAIAIAKTGPTSAVVGDVITYTLTVTNTTSTPLGSLVVTDPICDAAPVFTGGDTDSDALLELGETWTYTCSHVVVVGDPNPILNTATVQGTGAGRTVTDSASYSVPLVAVEGVKLAAPEPAPAPAPPTAVAGVKFTAPAPAPAPEVKAEVLPRTGAPIYWLLFWAGLFMLVGGLAVVCSPERVRH